MGSTLVLTDIQIDGSLPSWRRAARLRSRRERSQGSRTEDEAASSQQTQQVVATERLAAPEMGSLQPMQCDLDTLLSVDDAIVTITATVSRTSRSNESAARLSV